MEQETKFANIFGNNPDISQEERDRVVAELEKIGSLTFKVERNEEGWTAECIEVPAIITGNTNPSPTASEIESMIREAIFSAFNVRFEPDTAPTISPMQFGYSLQIA